MCNTTHPRKAHYFAYQLNSKAKSTLATCQCLAWVMVEKQNEKLNSEAKATPALPEAKSNPKRKASGGPTGQVLVWELRAGVWTNCEGKKPPPLIVLVLGRKALLGVWEMS